MKSIFFLLISFVLSIACYSQQKQLDSLLHLLKNHPNEDEERINLLNQIAFNYCEINPAKGLEIAGQVRTLALKLNNKAGVAKAYQTIGLNNSRLGNDSLAASLYEKAIEIFDEIHDSKSKAIVQYNLAEICANAGDYYNALDCLEKSSKVFEKEDSEFLKHIYNGKANIYACMSNYNKALEYYFKALPISEKSLEIETVATILGNIGEMFSSIGENSKSLQYHQKAYKLYEKSGNRFGEAFELEAMGNVHANLNDFLKALSFYKRALEINKSVGNRKGIASNAANIAINHYKRGDFGEALKLLPDAVRMYEELDDKYGLSTVLNMMAEVYSNSPDAILLTNGIKPAERFVKAEAYNLRALKLAKQAGSLEKQDKILVSMQSVYEKQKNYRKAIEVYKELLPLHDSLVNNKKKEEIAKQELQYEFDKKDAITAAEIQRQQTVKNALIAGGIMLLVASLLSFFFYKRKRDAEVQKTAAEFRVKVGDVEMKALRSQMNPHFIFNSLQSVNKYIMDNDKFKASEYLSTFAKLMRLILENSREQAVPLEQDLSALELYMQLESARFQNKFRYIIKVDPAVDMESTMVPPMLLQPLVENSIMHGLVSKDDGMIKIKITKEKHIIRCIVEDNGIGRQQSVIVNRNREKKHTSLGMRITQERLKIINEIKKAEAAIHFFDLEDENKKPGGLRVELLLPFEQAF